MQKITPCLWYDGDAEDAANLYCSIFPEAKISDTSRYPEGSGPMAGKVLTVTVEIYGENYLLLNGGPHFKFTEAVSFQILTEDQEETDRLWNALIADGGEESMCGWCKDRFGLSWQVTPKRLMQLMSDPDKARAGRAMGAMMQMKKIDIAALEAAAVKG